LKDNCQNKTNNLGQSRLSNQQTRSSKSGKVRQDKIKLLSQGGKIQNSTPIAVLFFEAVLVIKKFL